MSQTTSIQYLLVLIEQKLAWGNSNQWQGKDFENLSIEILNSTSVSLSASTLKRIWGKVDYQHLPSMTTLDTLSKFAGYDGWRDFQKQQHAAEEATAYQKLTATPDSPSGKRPMKTALVFSILLLIGVISVAAIWAMRKKQQPLNALDYHFGSEPLTHGIPNSVIFSYDASAAPTDSIFIQQSWDAQTRAAVPKNKHTYTSIYYEPGFYQAKLFVGNKIVKEHPLLIPTTGWLGLIGNRPVPFYLKAEQFLKSDSMSLSAEEFKKNGIAVSPEPPTSKFYNVGNFDPVPIDSFSFSASVKNTYKEGAGACQFSYIVLITDEAPIMIPLAIKGCISNLMLRTCDEVVSGKNTDLSGFGADFSEWANIVCTSANGKVSYFLNNRKIYETNAPTKKINIVGMGFFFQGTGVVKDVTLLSENKMVFSAFTGKK